jgi:hypothetical protein
MRPPKYEIQTRETARRIYVIEGKSVAEIADLLGIPVRTIHHWRVNKKWDKEIEDSGTINLYMEMQKQFIVAVKAAIEEGKLTDPATADALWKTAKLMERMMPAKVLLSNIFSFLEDLTKFFVAHVDNPEFMEIYQSQLPQLADWLRAKYTNET